MSEISGENKAELKSTKYSDAPKSGSITFWPKEAGVKPAGWSKWKLRKEIYPAPEAGMWIIKD